MNHRSRNAGAYILRYSMGSTKVFSSHDGGHKGNGLLVAPIPIDPIRVHRHFRVGLRMNASHRVMASQDGIVRRIGSYAGDGIPIITVWYASSTGGYPGTIRIASPPRSWRVSTNLFRPTPTSRLKGPFLEGGPEKDVERVAGGDEIDELNDR